MQKPVRESYWGYLLTAQCSDLKCKEGLTNNINYTLMTQPGSSQQNYDVIVFGCGPAGCAAALPLLENGFRVCMVSRENTHAFQVGENLEASARHLFPALRVDLHQMNEVHIPAYEKVSLWGSDDPVWHDSIFDVNSNGWHLDRKKFDNLLLQNCLQGGADWYRCSTLDIKYSGYRWLIRLSSHNCLKTITARFAIDASGRNRILNKFLSVPLLKYDTLMAINIVYNLSDECSESYTTVVEAVEHGWWYSSRLPENKRVVSFFTNAKSIHFKRMIRAEELVHAASATKILREIIGEIPSDQTTKPFFRYANSEKSTSLAGDSYLVTGDAAASFDPLSSQGIATALKMGGLAALSLLDHFSNDTSALENYCRTYEQLFTEYLLQRKNYYAMNRNFFQTEFWHSNS